MVPRHDWRRNVALLSVVGIAIFFIALVFNDVLFPHIDNPLAAFLASSNVSVCTPHAYCGDDGNVYDSCTPNPAQVCMRGCYAGRCLPLLHPYVVHFGAAATLVAPGASTTISWDAENVRMCMVQSTKGDAWRSKGGSYTEATRPISALTIFYLSCTGKDGTTISATTSINVR